MPNPHFIGLIHSLLSSAEASLGEKNSPMLTRLAKDGILARQTAQKSLQLLEMLHRKTHGNLDETEREALTHALKTIQARLEATEAPPETEGSSEALN